MVQGCKAGEFQSNKPVQTHKYPLPQCQVLYSGNIKLGFCYPLKTKPM